MILKIRCSRGHEWEWNRAEGSAIVPPVCPICSEFGSLEGITATTPGPPDATLMTAQFRSGGPQTEREGPAQETMSETPSGLPEIPGYDVLAELGRGGMGVVYKARQRGLNRIVALKMILAGGHAGKGDLERFRNEAESVAKLQHPNIVQIYEVGEDNGKPFFSLEYLDGGSLETKRAGKSYPPRAAAAMVESLARAMHFAHQHGVLHRDLKPANVLLTESGTPKITDFGLAKRMDADSGQTHSGSILGTPSYMAPEQAMGHTREIGPLADVYALGAIVYDLLTGRPPFRAPSAWDTISQVIHDEPVPPTRLDSKVPRDLETICLKALQKEPRRRYGSAEELADDLKRFQAGEPIQARPIGAAERLVKWARRRPAVAALTFLSLLVTALGIGLVTWQWQEARLAYQDADEARRREKRQKEDAEKREQTEAEARKQAVAAREEAEESRRNTERERLRAEAALAKANALLIGNRLSWAEREWLQGNMNEAVAVLTDVDTKDRDWEWNYLQRLVTGSQLTMHVGGLNFLDGTFSADDKQAIVMGTDGRVRFWDLETGKEVRDFDAHTSHGFGLALSPDGKWLATAGWDHHARIWDVATGKERAKVMHDDEKVYRVAFSPSGSRVASSCQDKLVRIFDLDGKQLVTCTGHTAYAIGLAFSSDSKRLASSGGDGVVRVWDAATGEEKLTLNGHQGLVRGVTFSPDDSRIVSAGSDGTLRFWDAGSGEARGVIRNTTGAFTDVAFSPDGQYVAAACADRAVRVYSTSDGKAVLVHRGHVKDVVSIRYSKDGKWLISGAFDATAKVWDAKRDTRPRALKNHTGTLCDLALSKDGTMIASGGSEGTIVVCDARTGDRITSFIDFTGSARAVRFSPDAKLLAGSDGTGTIFLWDLAKYNRVKSLPPEEKNTAEAHALAFDPKGQYLASGGDGTLRLWDVKEGKVARTLSVPKGRLWSVAFSPDGKRLSTSNSNGKVYLYSLDKEAEPVVLEGHLGAVYQTEFTKDGRQLWSCGGDGTLRSWDVKTGKELLHVNTRQPNFDMALHPAGKRLAVGCEDGSILIVDAIRGEEVYRLRRAHPNGVRCVRFDDSGGRLLSGGNDDFVRVWDDRNGPINAKESR